jgi:exopolysaccharide biosynthesis polyprenyl glycosylphosphotransferase
VRSTDGVGREDLAPEVDERRVGPDRRISRRFRRSRSRAVLRSAPITEGDAAPVTSGRDVRYRWTLIAVDATVAVLVVLLLPAVFGSWQPLVALAAAPLLIALNKMLGLYDRDELVLNKTTLDEAPSLFQATAVFTLLIWLVLDGATTAEIGARAVILTWAGTFTLLTAGRVAGRGRVRHATAAERCLVVGEPASIAAIREKVTVGAVNAEAVATLELTPFAPSTGEELAGEFRALVRRHEVHRAIIAPPSDAPSTDTLHLIRAAKHAGVRVSLVPRLLEVVGSTVEFDHLDGLTMLGVRRFGLSRSSRLLKRAFDIAGSSAMLVVAAPATLVIMAAIRIDSPGPLLFHQTRVGRDGRHFQMLKFRSMFIGADGEKEELRHLNETDGLFKIESDPRVTRVGRFLRRTCLDELPQLLNVLRGEMSLVGPRPLVVDEDAQVQGFDRHRLHLTPGMTGHWQILGSPRVPMHEMVGIDYLYVANWSLWSDIKILLRTIPYMLARRGM